jgi:DNA-directed RNA polymerase subunit F
MKATGSLPSEQRCKDMNDAQWLWFYFNLLKDIEEDRDKTKSELDYLGAYINPEAAKYVSEQDKKRKLKEQQQEKSERAEKVAKDNGEDIDKYRKDLPALPADQQYADTAVNTEFEKELADALKASGASADELTELPDSKSAGNEYESKDDFLSRVQQFSDLAGKSAGYKSPREKRNLDNSDLLDHDFTKFAPPPDDKELFNKQLTKKINNAFDLTTTSTNFDIGNNVNYDLLNKKIAEKEKDMNMDIIQDNIDTVYEQTSEDLDIFCDDE